MDHLTLLGLVWSNVACLASKGATSTSTTATAWQ